jgi:MraZ protein
MGTFFGSYERTLDPKGRLILPAKLRAEFGESAYLTRYVDGCLALYDQEDMERQTADMLAMVNAPSREDRMFARVWASSITEVTFDAQGRIPIPAHQRTWSGLETEVLVIGAIERVEIWSPLRYGEGSEPANTQMLEGSVPANRQ